MAIQSYFLWSFLQRFGTFVIRLLGLIVLARLLTPSDYGTFAAASMVILAVTIIIEFGASAHLNRVKEVTAGIIGSSLLFSGGIGLVLIPLVYICAPTIGELVSVNAVEEPLRLMLLGLTVAPFTAVTNALLIRDGKFRRQMHVGLAVESFATALSVALAIAGQGIQALAIAAVVTNVGVLIGTVSIIWSRGTIGFSTETLMEQLKTGFSASGLAILMPAQQLFMQAFIVRSFGLVALGHFNRAQNLSTLCQRLLIETIRPVALFEIGRQVREGTSLKRSFLLKTEILAGLAWPGAIVAIIWSESLIRVVLGDGWLDTIPVFAILCLTLVSLPFTALNHEMFSSLGRLPAYLRQELIIQGATVGLVWLACISGDLSYVAWALVSVRLLSIVLSYFQLWKPIDILAKDLASCLKPSLLVALVCGSFAGLWLNINTYFDLKPLWFLAIGIPLIAGVWFVAILFSRHIVWREWRLLLNARNK
jgi:O-antigen/teichoic acid export membrane protein